MFLGFTQPKLNYFVQKLQQTFAQSKHTHTIEDIDCNKVLMFNDLQEAEDKLFGAGADPAPKYGGFLVYTISTNKFYGIGAYGHLVLLNEGIPNDMRLTISDTLRSVFDDEKFELSNGTDDLLSLLNSQGYLRLSQVVDAVLTKLSVL